MTVRSIKKAFKRAVCAAAALAFSATLCVAPAFASPSPLLPEFGAATGGLYLPQGKSDLKVAREKLTFYVGDLPGIVDSSEGEYTSCVTAEYDLFNPSSETVTTTLAFPFKTPEYATIGTGFCAAPALTLNGESVAAQVRYTPDVGNDYESSALCLSGSWYEDDFYRSDMPAYIFTVRVESAFADRLYVKGTLIADDAKAKAISNGDDGQLFEYVGEDGEATFYALGDATAVNPDFAFYQAGSSSDIEVQAPSVMQIEETTLKDLVLSFRSENSRVGETEWYNAVVSSFRRTGARACYPWELCDTGYAVEWYVYDLELAAGESAVFSVTAPLFPDVYFRYSPEVYKYRCLLPRSQNWASFGSLEAEIVTDFYGIGLSDAFIATDRGYRATFSSLPEGELTFSLCTQSQPSRIEDDLFFPQRGSLFVLIVIAAIALFVLHCAVCLIGGLICLVVLLPKYLSTGALRRKIRRGRLRKKRRRKYSPPFSSRSHKDSRRTFSGTSALSGSVMKKFGYDG